MTDALAAADAYLAFLSRYRHAESDGPMAYAELGESAAAKQLFDGLRGQEAPVYRYLAERLVRVPDPYAAAVLAVQLGSMVEDGEDPAALGEAMAARLPADLAAACRYVELLASKHGIE